METIFNFILSCESAAPWMIFGLLLLAGMSIPISIDIMLVITAIIAAQVLPGKAFILFLSVLSGCYFSAWIAFWIGRLAGEKLMRYRWFSRLFHKERLERWQKFYTKRSFLTLLIGRFIPFGVRNCLFMTAGMSRSSFVKFLLCDLVACTLWVSTFFTLFYTLGKNYETMVRYAKVINIAIFAAFSVTVIGLIWYKRTKSTKDSADV